MFSDHLDTIERFRFGYEYDYEFCYLDTLYSHEIFLRHHILTSYKSRGS